MDRIDLVRMEDGSRSGVMVKSVSHFFISLVTRDELVKVSMDTSFDGPLDPTNYKFFRDNGTIILRKTLDEGLYKMTIVYENFNASFTCQVTGPWGTIHESEHRAPSYIAFAFAFIVLFVFCCILSFVAVTIFTIVFTFCFVKIEH